MVCSAISHSGKLTEYLLTVADPGINRRGPSKHKTFVKHLYNVGPTSKMLGRRCTNVIQMFCVCWGAPIFNQNLYTTQWPASKASIVYALEGSGVCFSTILKCKAYVMHSRAYFVRNMVDFFVLGTLDPPLT